MVHVIRSLRFKRIRAHKKEELEGEAGDGIYGYDLYALINKSIMCDLDQFHDVICAVECLHE